MPDPDDHRGVAGVGEDQRGVLGGGAGLEPQRADAEPLERSVAAAVAAAVDADDDVAGGPQHLGGRAAGLVVAGRRGPRCRAGSPAARERVGAARRRRSGPGAARAGRAGWRRSSAAKSWPRDDHDHRPAGDPGGRPGQAPAVQQQVLLAAQELGAVVGERLQLGWPARSGRRPSRPRRSSASTIRPRATGSSST